MDALLAWVMSHQLLTGLILQEVIRFLPVKANSILEIIGQTVVKTLPKSGDEKEVKN